MPVAGIDCPEELSSFIQDWITCHTRDITKISLQNIKCTSAANTARKSVRLFYLDADSIFLHQDEIVFASMILKIA